MSGLALELVEAAGGGYTSGAGYQGLSIRVADLGAVCATIEESGGTLLGGASTGFDPI